MADVLTPPRSEPRQALSDLAASYGFPVMETAQMLAMEDAFDVLPLAKAMKRKGVLLREGGELWAVISDPLDLALQSWMERCAAAAVKYALALPEDILAYLSRKEEGARATDGMGSETGSYSRERKPAAVLSLAGMSESASPAVKLVNSVLYDALKVAASDIHIESTPGGMEVKFRIDGVLDHALSVAGVETAEHVISRLKVLAELDIAERRVPQDGSFTVESSGRDIDMRLSVMPSIHGEDAVIRVLDKRAMIESYGALTLEALGFDEAALVTLRRLAAEPYGMLLVTGPTGSGKTTTLYGALTEIHDGKSKIITIEDPVEYQLPGILQIPVNEKKGLTFAKGLRSILRHDPDKIMVGEIRDNETAEIAVQSALTGHLVLTTVHANNVFDVLGRFTHMGIDPYSFVSALNGIWAQRLLRVNCPHCSAPHVPSASELALLRIEAEDLSQWNFRAGAGCGDCRGTGYKGRRAIAEVLLLSDEIRELIIDRAPIRAIKELARKAGTRTLREVAMAMAQRGETTIAEVSRVTLHA
ncbi:GspE/PulE family protein [Limnohabitans sp.]|uniref:GspE/PulE family protein n=1 Tax=Limnohabitans sp. TaxID=1907725 RepID=UPI0038BDAA6F